MRFSHVLICLLNLCYCWGNFSLVYWTTDHRREPHSSSALFQVCHISAFATVCGQRLSPSPSLCTLFLSAAHKAGVVGWAAGLRGRAVGSFSWNAFKTWTSACVGACVSEPCLLPFSDLSKKSSLSPQARLWLHGMIWWVTVQNSDSLDFQFSYWKTKQKIWSNVFVIF